MHRRAFLAASAAITCSPAWGAPEKQTHTYKRVGDLEIQADVYRAGPAAILWLHGGALIFGHRGNLRPAQMEKYTAAGYTVVSVDYRLAPEVKLPEILKDLEDAWTWVQRDGPKLFGIDPRRVAIIGHSAGGYLSLCCGYRCQPRPRALVSFYGFGDITADWEAKPSPFYLKQPAVSKDDAYGSVGGKVVTGTPGPNQRARFYLYCRQQGLWPQEVAGLDPVTENKRFNPYCPARNVTKRYPPTLLLHGDADTDVPFSQSEQMASELKRRDVEHELIRIPGGPHGFDGRMNDPLAAEAFAKVLVFLNRRLG